VNKPPGGRQQIFVRVGGYKVEPPFSIQDPVTREIEQQKIIRFAFAKEIINMYVDRSRELIVQLVNGEIANRRIHEYPGQPVKVPNWSR
jgi:hypothetical protein